MLLVLCHDIFKRALRNINLLDLLPLKNLPSSWISYIRPTHLPDPTHQLPLQILQPRPPIYPSIGQHDWIVLHIALGVMRIRDVTR